MTELAVPEAPAVPAVQPAPVRELTALEQWAANAKVIANLAVSIAKTSFAGTLRGKPEEVTAVILAGDELGLKPMAALKAFDIIQGTPALRAHAMRGLVMSKGHQVQLVESTPEKCVYRGRRQGDSDWQYVTWTLERARLLGLTGKPEWKKQPQTMLIARGTGEICRLIASDALHGVPYTSEELQDSTVVRGEAAVARPALSVAALTFTAPAAVAEPATQVTDIDADDTEDGVWQQDGEDEPNPWPETAQPGAGIPQ